MLLIIDCRFGVITSLRTVSNVNFNNELVVTLVNLRPLLYRRGSLFTPAIEGVVVCCVFEINLNVSKCLSDENRNHKWLLNYTSYFIKIWSMVLDSPLTTPLVECQPHAQFPATVSEPTSYSTDHPVFSASVCRLSLSRYRWLVCWNVYASNVGFPLSLMRLPPTASAEQPN